MSAPKWTPGPWQVNQRHKDQVCDSDGEVRGCSPIATAYGRPGEKLANARLIATAPKLYESLVSAVERLEDMLKGDDGQAWQEAEAFVLRAAVVLREARGEA